MSVRLLVFCALAALSCAAGAQTYECVDGKGATRYSPSPCPPGETERDLRKIRRIGGERKAQSSNEYFEEERVRKDKAREAAARAQEEQRRERELLRLEREMRYDAAADLLNKLQAEKAAGK